jgi:hypothetical protein
MRTDNSGGDLGKHLSIEWIGRTFHPITTRRKQRGTGSFSQLKPCMQPHNIVMREARDA